MILEINLIASNRVNADQISFQIDEEKEYGKKAMMNKKENWKKGGVRS